MKKPKGLYILAQDSFELVYGPQERADIERLVDIYHAPLTRALIAKHPEVLTQAEVIFSGWEAPMLNQSFLDAAPNFKAFFYGAGTIDYCLSNAFWASGIAVTSAIEANSQPVAEYTLAVILFSLKHGWQLTKQTRKQRRFVERNAAPGAYGSTVGLVSLGRVARRLLKLLAPLDLHVIAYDPFLDEGEATELGVEKVSLTHLFQRSDVVSLHTPLLPETRGMVTGKMIASMKTGATFINTARGEVAKEGELISVAVNRPDLHFVLDVTDPESPTPESPLYTLPNVVLTPHIAGSAGGECRRMGRCMVEELERYIAGEPLRWAERRPVEQRVASADPLVKKSGVKLQINTALTRKPDLVRRS